MRNNDVLSTCRFGHAKQTPLSLHPATVELGHACMHRQEQMIQMRARHGGVMSCTACDTEGILPRCCCRCCCSTTNTLTLAVGLPGNKTGQHVTATAAAAQSRTRASLTHSPLLLLFPEINQGNTSLLLLLLLPLSIFNICCVRTHPCCWSPRR